MKQSENSIVTYFAPCQQSLMKCDKCDNIV